MFLLLVIIFDNNYFLIFYHEIETLTLVFNDRISRCLGDTFSRLKYQANMKTEEVYNRGFQNNHASRDRPLSSKTSIDILLISGLVFTFKTTDNKPSILPHNLVISIYEIWYRSKDKSSYTKMHYYDEFSITIVDINPQMTFFQSPAA